MSPSERGGSRGRCTEGSVRGRCSASAATLAAPHHVQHARTRRASAHSWTAKPPDWPGAALARALQGGAACLHGGERGDEVDEREPSHEEANAAPAHDLRPPQLGPLSINRRALLLARRQSASPVGILALQHDAEERVAHRRDEDDEHGEQEPVEGDVIEHLERHADDGWLGVSRLSRRVSRLSPAARSDLLPSLLCYSSLGHVPTALVVLVSRTHTQPTGRLSTTAGGSPC